MSPDFLFFFYKFKEHMHALNIQGEDCESR